MKIPSIPRAGRLAVRFLVPALAALCLLTLAGCGKPESWLPFGDRKSACEKAYESLETQFRDLKASVTGGITSADRAAFWQTTAALFIVVSGFALVGGAALGSRARRHRERFHHRQSAAADATDDAQPASPVEVIA